MPEHKDCDMKQQPEVSDWDHTSHEKFYDFYAKASLGEQTLRRFRSIRDVILRVVERGKREQRALEVADIGCGAGTQSILWAELGHHVHGLDINEPLVELAKVRAAEAGYPIDFRVGSAVALPWPDASMDVCIAPELLEHVADWESCLNEFGRILRPGGVLFAATTNKLCPIQSEFTLPLYSWYPSFLKRRIEHLSVTTCPQLANFAKYPAVNWFTFYSLRAALVQRGFFCLDRFDVMNLSDKGTLKKWIVLGIRNNPLFRWLAHVATEGTMVFAVKKVGRSG